MVIILQAQPVRSEFVEAVFVDVVDPLTGIVSVYILAHPNPISIHCVMRNLQASVWPYSHARGTSRHLSPLPQAIQLAPPVRLGLALHVVVVIRSTSRADEKSCTE